MFTCEKLGVAGNVGHDAQARPCSGRAEAPEAGENLIEDDQHAAIAATLRQDRLEQRVYHLHAIGALH